ncbi:MAG: T9SS type A sorting domain-containing protein [Bacteroidales bacterium]|nr:T9SS type A sorting domain-containing protein [Bacteroidales bacterium]
MKMKKRILHILNALTLCLLFAFTPALAQNNLLPTNVSNFNIGTPGNGHSSNNLSNAGVTTNYTYKKNENSLQSNVYGPGCYAVGDNARWYNHQSDFGIERGYFSMGDHTSGIGNYMIVNGDSIPNRIVWEYTVDVAPGVIYDFQAWTTCLFIRIAGLPSLNTRPRLRLLINDTPVSDNSFPVPWEDGGLWTLWSESWTAGNNTTSAKITIIDECTERDGNDFGLDDIVFKMKDGYSLSANPFTVSYCGEITPIDLSNHYTMNYPSNGNSAPPMEVKIRKGNYDGWQTHINLDHGTATVGSDNRITYTPNANFYGQDSFQYKISRFGLESHATITVNIGDFPSDCTPQGLPDTLCISDVSSFNPSATWEPIGINITNSGWLYKKVSPPASEWQESAFFQTWVPSDGGVGEYSIKFFAQNSCTGNNYVYSEPYNFTICDVPEITGPDVTSICTGSAEPTPDIVPKYNTVHLTWQYKRNNGSWIDFTWGQFDLQPGDQIRCRVTWDYCGGSPWISSNIDVVSGPEFNASIPVSFNEGYCPGDSEELPQIQSSWYNSHNMDVESGWYYVIENSSGSPDYNPVEGNTITLPNNGSVSVTPCLYNDECGFTPYYPAFNLVVWDAPSIQGLENLPDSLGPVCSGTTLSSILPALSPSGHFLDNGYGWEISSGQSQTGFSSNLPTQLSFGDNGRWLRYHVQKDCTAHNDIFSDPIRVWVGTAPTLSPSQIEPFGTVCSGTSVASLVDVQVDWNLFHDEDSFDRWEVYINNTWTEFTEFDLIHNGCQVRYHAHNECGDAFVDAGIVNVTEGPSFNNPELPLSFNSYYCDGDILSLPTHPNYDGHGINVSDEYWAYFDGIEYHRITSPLQLDESWNGYQITYVLESDCGGEGGEIRYPTPYTLIVKGNPEVEISMSGNSTFCVDTPIALHVDIDWHRCTPDTQTSSWQYTSDQLNYFDFDPNVGIPESGAFFVNYHAVAIECGFEAYGNPLSVMVEAAPEFVNPEQPFELGRFCEDTPLVLPDDPAMTGHVEDSLWRISIGTNPNGEYELVPSNYLLSINDDGRWLQYYAIGCNTPIHYELEIHVDGKPWEEYSIADRICKGQLLSYQRVNTNGYPVTNREWSLNPDFDPIFNPDVDTFDEEGTYTIYYRVWNDCGPSETMGPEPLIVSAGPQFDNSTLPNGTQYVCEGTTIGELLQQSGITEPSLVDPSIPHNPLGWFINDQAVELGSVIGEVYHGAELRYGVSSNCSDIPVYSSGILLHVYGRPEVTQMPSIDWEFCDGDPVQLPDPEINFHHGEGHVNGYWQIQSTDGSWGNLPTTWNANDNGSKIRYRLEHTVCSDLDNDSGERAISVFSAPIINDDLPTTTVIPVCTDGPLEINEPGVQPEPNVSGWQVSSDGSTWSTVLDGHTFNPNHVAHFFDGMYLRYHAESTQCPDLEDNSMVYTIQLINSPTINDDNWPNPVQYCSGGSLGIEVPSGLSGEWQVSDDGTYWDTQLDGHSFDENHIDDYFDGKFVRYYVHSSCGDAESKVLTLSLKDSEQLGTINGASNVYVASSLISGIYRYEIDTEGLAGPATWSLSNLDWQIIEHGDDFCRVFVTTPGAATLTAHFNVEECGEMERSFEINAVFYGVDDYQGVDVHIFPNPTKGSVTIETEGIESLRLIDMMGQVLETREYDRSDSVTLNLSTYTPSVYLFEIKTVYGVVKKRLILCR